MMPTEPAWSLHPQLRADTVEIGDLPLSRVLLMNDANYPWLLLVPRCAGVTEIIDLADTRRAELMGEIARVAGVLKQITACDKLNIAAIGNVVPQLHVHVVARRRGDPAWPRPVWGAAPALAYDPTARTRLVATIRKEIAFR
jgi:diadenosine tetraphosphate (Ap4A) HIT family hydrolase